MKLPSKMQDTQEGQITSGNAPSPAALGDLTPLINLIVPLRARIAEYDRAVHALATTRERLRDLPEEPPAEMTLTVQRELVAAAGDSEALAKWDAAHGQDLAAERERRAAIARDRQELPARIVALEEAVRQVAVHMVAEDPIADIEEQAQALFAPYAERLVLAAKQYANRVQEALTVANALRTRLAITEYDLFADYKRTHRPEFIGALSGSIVPEVIAGVSCEELADINRRFRQSDDALVAQVDAEIEAAGLSGAPLRFYTPSTKDGARRIHAPELTRVVRAPQVPPGAVATVVTINN